MGHVCHVDREGRKGQTDGEDEGGYCSLIENKMLVYSSFTLIVQTLNPSIEAPVARILSNLSTLFQAPLTTFSLTTPTERGEGKTLIINGTMSGLPFTWHFQCQPAETNAVRWMWILYMFPTTNDPQELFCTFCGE